MHDRFKTVYFFCHYAQQPPYNTALRYHNWGKELVKRDYNVTIFCANVVHNTSIDIINLLCGNNTSQCDGIQYVYVRTREYSGNGIDRIQNMLQYYLRVKRIAKKYKKPDVCLCCEAYLVNRVRNLWVDVPCICDIEDLWPEALVGVLGINGNNPIMRFLYYVEKNAYKKYIREKYSELVVAMILKCSRMHPIPTR